VNQFFRRISALLLFGLSTIPVRAANPDLSLAPLPTLSQTAWGELQANHTDAKEVTLKATITARRGTVTEVTVKETARWPQTSAEVQAWIKQHWKFVPAYSGTVVQPVSFKILQGYPTTTRSKPDPWMNTAWDLLLRSPKPDFPARYRAEVHSYIQSNNYRRAPGVYLSITARNGVIVDIRVLDQTGPSDLSTFTVNWIRNNWQFKPNANGRFGLPVYYIW
jgi:hypothetical protein